jgi:polyisoprenoid-binding protein YceI
MKKLMIVSMVILSFGFLFAGDIVKVDVSKSSIGWLGKKVTGQHNGTISLKSGEFKTEDGKLIGGSFDVDMTSIVVEDLKDADWNAKLVGHLKSDDFFSVEKFPAAAFKITDVKAVNKDGSNYHIKGELTIKGITNTIEFPAKVENSETGTSASARIVVDRAKFDVRYGSGSFFENLGDKMIYDDFTLDVKLVSAVK